MPSMAMNVHVDFRSGVPIYVQIVEQIRQRVVAGDLQPGDQLPTVRQLATDLRVNFNTVARAYRLLDEAGLISTQQGRGTFILEPPAPHVEDALRREALDGMARRFLHEALRLGCSPAEIRAAVDKYLSSESLPLADPEQE